MCEAESVTVCMALMPSCCYHQSEQSNTFFFSPFAGSSELCVCVYVWPHGVPLCVQCRIPYVCLCERMRARTFPGSSTSGCRSEFLSSF